MSSSTDTAQGTMNVGRWLLFTGLALLALAAGVTVSLMTSATDGATGNAATSSAADEELMALQDQLVSSQVLPADFRHMPDFSLIDGDGEPITAAFLDDRWTMFFFGFTHCPDVCPITLSVMQGVAKQLEQTDVPPLQVAFVSVDPVRDTPEVMGQYVDFFDPDFIGITGEQNDVHALTGELGIVAAFTANDENPENYSVDHTASMLLVDPERRVRAKFSPPHKVETIIADYRTLVTALD